MDQQFAWTPTDAYPKNDISPSQPPPAFAHRQPSFSGSGPSPYPSPHVGSDRSGSAPVLQPVKEDFAFTSPPLSSGGLASMSALDPASASSRLGSGYQNANGGVPEVNGFGDLVRTSFGTGSIGEIWGEDARAGTMSPFRHEVLLNAAPFEPIPSGLSTPYDPLPVPPSTASLIAARPYTAGAASALVFMSQSGSLDGADPGVDSPVFAADAMLQRVTQDGSYASSTQSPDQVYGASARPGSSHQLASQPAVNNGQSQQYPFAYAPSHSSRNSFAMENLSLQPNASFAYQVPIPNALPQGYPHPPSASLPASLQFTAAHHPPAGQPSARPTSSHSRPVSQAGPDRRALQAGSGSSGRPPSASGYPQPSGARSNSFVSANRPHPYSRPAFNSLSAASGKQSWEGSQELAQIYQAMRPQTSDGVPMSYYAENWGLPLGGGSSMFPPVFQTIPPQAYAPSSSRPSTSYAAQVPSMLDPPHYSHPPPFADPRQLHGQPGPSSILPPQQLSQVAPPASHPPSRPRAHSAAVPRTSASSKVKSKAKVEPDSEEEDEEEEKPREISAVTGRPKRPRRKFEEVERNYVCNWAGCGKAYGTLNHLNAHVLSQGHGEKRMPSEYRDLRKIWRKQRRERVALDGAPKPPKRSGSGKRKAQPTAATVKRRKSSTEQSTLASDDVDDSHPQASDHRRQSMVSLASTRDGDYDDESSDEDDPHQPSSSTNPPGPSGARRYSSPPFLPAGPTPPAHLANYTSPYYNLDIPSYNGVSTTAALGPVPPPAAGVVSPFADWSFAPSPSVAVASGTTNPAAFLAPTPGTYEAVSLDFGAGPPSEASTTGTPRHTVY